LILFLPVLLDPKKYVDTLIFLAKDSLGQRIRRKHHLTMQREIFRFKKQSAKRMRRRRLDGRHRVRDAISFCASLDDFSFSLSLQKRSSLLDERDGASDMMDRSNKEENREENVKAHGRRQIVDAGRYTSTRHRYRNLSFPSFPSSFPSFFLLFPGRSIADIYIIGHSGQ